MLRVVRSDADVMLLCDGCDRGFHIFCLDPPLDAVPEDTIWLCQQCDEAMQASERAESEPAPLEKRAASAGPGRAGLLAVGAAEAAVQPIQPHEPLRIVHTETDPDVNTWALTLELDRVRAAATSNYKETIYRQTIAGME